MPSLSPLSSLDYNVLLYLSVPALNSQNKPNGSRFMLYSAVEPKCFLFRVRNYLSPSKCPVKRVDKKIFIIYNLHCSFTHRHKLHAFYLQFSMIFKNTTPLLFESMKFPIVVVLRQTLPFLINT